MSDLFTELEELQSELNMLRKNRDKIAGMQFTTTQELGRLRGMIEPLLLRIHLYEDMEARQEFDEVQSEMVELKELVKHIPSLLTQADSKISTLDNSVKYKQAQIDKLVERQDRLMQRLKNEEKKLESNPLMAPQIQERIETIKAQLKQ